MPQVPPKSVPIALDKCDTGSFEKYSQAIFSAVMNRTFKPLGGHKDGGADGFVDNDISEDVKAATTFFQASKEADVESKIRKTIARLKEVGREAKTLHYASSREVKFIDVLENNLSNDLDVNIRIYDSAYFETRANYSDATQAAFFSYLQPSLAFLEEALAPSFPSSPAFQDAREVSAFLSQEVDRKLGTTRTLESICDALILWALEGTDPATNKLMSIEEIIAKVEDVIPTARHFFRGEVANRVRALAKKVNGQRIINIYAKDGRYCLPYDSRQILSEHTIEDEALKISVSDGFKERLLTESGGSYKDRLITQLVDVLHRTLESVFEKQGFDASRHFLGETEVDPDGLEARTITEIAQEKMVDAGIKIDRHVNIIYVMRQVLRGIFYSSTEHERAYCCRLSRTYVLLFTIRNTPEIINYFNTMAKRFFLYVGSDLLVRAISEYYLQPEDQMTVNALKILKQAGSKLILTEQMLEEVHSHIYASEQEYYHHYREVDFWVDEDLASQANKILIRAYYYAKLDPSNLRRPRTWEQFINNYLSLRRMTSSLSENTMKELRDTLCSRFGMEFESRDDQEKLVDQAALDKLTAKIRSMRRPGKREELAQNDAFMILRLAQHRRDKESKVAQPYGYSSWYLTQDSVSNSAYGIAFGKMNVRLVMPPDFLINYIAYNPTTDEVKESLRTIFPSVLGVRLGARLEPRVLHNVMKSIHDACEVDEHRAKSIVAEHADALKSSRIRQFALKYGDTGQ